MLIVIAPEVTISEEINRLNQLFEAGLACYHLRKPKMNLDEHIAYLNGIHPKFHNRIVVHLFHELASEFPLKGVHFQEEKRKVLLKTKQTDYFKAFQANDLTISSSFHSPEDISNSTIDFDYQFLSPVFTSISKTGYIGRGFDVNSINKIVIGLGGVRAENIAKMKVLGYDGVGLLGGVWNTDNPVESFKKIKDSFEQS
ncbi:thiamine phosphate synthase [Aequorivita xiaoshiensis]|uniref:Thiamine phosphate synthase n=1 Tax=Aequorivita xiaoshiensis TaxID=2874476 RepID=A0A9X1U6P9_9FLAO|nr:thiamine phosphate synthase [Aequorivita xiaoshiensis]MCG2431833.1 thiamine phosphate synthase [Aequorivita xiaoshiensis]